MVANNTIMIIGLIKIFRNIVIKDNGISELFKYIYHKFLSYKITILMVKQSVVSKLSYYTIMVILLSPSLVILLECYCINGFISNSNI